MQGLVDAPARIWKICTDLGLDQRIRVTDKNILKGYYIFQDCFSVYTAKVRFYGTYGVCCACVASVINSGIHDAINICSSKCISIFYDYIELQDLLCDEIRTVPTRA